MLTREEFTTLAERAQVDPRPLIEGAFKVKTKMLPGQSPVQSLKFNKAQRRIHASVMRQREAGKPARVIVLKARQCGGSALGEGYVAAAAMSCPYSNSLQVAHLDDTATHLFRGVQFMFENLPPELRPSFDVQRRNEVLLDALPCSDGDVQLRSAIHVATAGGGEPWRGRTVQVAHISELAYMTWPGEVLLGISQAIPPTPQSLVYIESTANGIGNVFHEEYYRAKNGESEFEAVFIPWFDVDEYVMPVPPGFLMDADEKEMKLAYGLRDEQIQWRRFALYSQCRGSIELFNQEFPSCVAAGTRVGTDRGLIPVEEVAPGDRLSVGVVEHVKIQPSSPVYRLKTALGYTLSGTFDHPLMTPGGVLVPLLAAKGVTVRLRPPRLSDTRQWVRWQDTGVQCAVEITEEWGRLIGLYMGDGSFSGDTLSIACDGKDVDLVEEVKRLVLTLLQVAPTSRNIGPNKGCAEVRANSIRLKYVLRALGLIREEGVKGPRRIIHIPEYIWRSPKTVVREFLRGLFEADGFNGFNQPRIVFYSKNPDFVADVQQLLLAMGVRSRRTSTLRRNKTHEYIANELCLRGHEVAAYMEDVGFLSARKSSRLWAQKVRGRRAFPNAMEDVVASVDQEENARTYDLTVDGDHLFDANGLLTHNTESDAFLLSGRPAFNTKKLRAMYEHVRQFQHEEGVITEQGFSLLRGGPLKVWKRPIHDHDYTIGADPSSGSEGGDPACAVVFDRDTSEMVATWHGMMDPIYFAHVCGSLGRWYNEALLAPELNSGYGHSMVGELKSIQYPRLYVWQRVDKVKQVITNFLGWETTYRTKQYLIDTTAHAINEDEIMYFDPAMIQELIEFSYFDGRRAEGSGKHDDRSMACMIAYRVHIESPLLSTGIPPRVKYLDDGPKQEAGPPPPTDGISKGAWEDADRELGKSKGNRLQDEVIQPDPETLDKDDNPSFVIDHPW